MLDARLHHESPFEVADTIHGSIVNSARAGSKFEGGDGDKDKRHLFRNSSLATISWMSERKP